MQSAPDDGRGPAMSLQQVTFEVAGVHADTLSDALMAAGALSVEVTDADAGTADEKAAFDEPGEAARAWKRCIVTVLFAADADVDEVLREGCAAVDAPFPSAHECSALEDQDWVRLTRSQFKPIRITSRLWIIPSWETAPEPNAVNLRLDPGVAFGTGSHPTTRLCLLWLASHLPAGAQVLDYGCGSGILAIAALRLGAARAVGVDIDPQALVAARENAVQNEVDAEFCPPGSEPAIGYRVVLANILANPLIALAPLLAARTRPGGTVVLSGVLEDQAAEVSEVYGAWFEMATPLVEEGWALLVGHRHGEHAS